MTIEGVDYSFDRPSPSCLRLFGKEFACRYLTRLSSSKLITASEANTLTLAGVNIVLGYEDTQRRSLDGYSAGLADAETAGKLADSIGCPPDRPIYFAVDWDATDSDMARVAEYLKGASAHLGFYRIGVYGGYNAVRYCYVNRAAKWFWQTYAWSGGLVHIATHLYQYSNGHTLCGAAVDYDRAIQVDYGGWKVGHYTPAPPSDTLPNITQDSSWDYSGQITGASTGVAAAAVQLGHVTAAVNQLRT